MKLKKALIIVDVQNDFCPGGALGIRDGDKIMPFINKYVRFFVEKKLPVLVTRDWHPKVTKHFKKFGGAWPKHCVQGTLGAEFYQKFRVPKEAIILSKGMDPEKDSYSAFGAVDANNTELQNLLKIFGVNELYIGGLATDYCVKYTALDALKNGFKVFFLTDAVKGVDLNPGDSEDAIKEIVASGAKVMTFEKLKPR